jgi:hypothetical protein
MFVKKENLIRRLLMILFVYPVYNFFACIQIAFRFSYADKKEVIYPKINPSGFVGILIGFPISIITLVSMTLTRFVFETIRMAFIAAIFGFIEGQKFLRLLPNVFQYQHQLSKYQKILGAIGKITYLPSFILSIAYNSLVNLFLYYSIKNSMDCLDFFWNLVIYDIRPKAAVAQKDIIGRHNYFGIIGYPIGSILGLSTSLFALGIRFIIELLPGFYLGLMGNDLLQAEQPIIRTILKFPSYVLGYYLFSNFKLFIHLQEEVIRWFLPVKSLQLQFEKNLTGIELVLGIGGGVVGAPFALAIGILILGWRIGVESLKSFCQAIQPILPPRIKLGHDLQLNKPLAYGLAGQGLGYLVRFIFHLTSALLMPMIKWGMMVHRPRFTKLEQSSDEDVLNHIKSLYGALNNLSRQFPAKNSINLEKNPSGGKGSYCFIAKALSFNQSTISEFYLDEVLSVYRANKALCLLDLNLIRTNLQSKLCFNFKSKLELERAHTFVRTNLHLGS